MAVGVLVSAPSPSPSNCVARRARVATLAHANDQVVLRASDALGRATDARQCARGRRQMSVQKWGGDTPIHTVGRPSSAVVVVAGVHCWRAPNEATLGSPWLEGRKIKQRTVWKGGRGGRGGAAGFGGRAADRAPPHHRGSGWWGVGVAGARRAAAAAAAECEAVGAPSPHDRRTSPQVFTRKAARAQRCERRGERATGGRPDRRPEQGRSAPPPFLPRGIGKSAAGRARARALQGAKKLGAQNPPRPIARVIFFFGQGKGSRIGLVCGRGGGRGTAYRVCVRRRAHAGARDSVCSGQTGDPRPRESRRAADALSTAPARAPAAPRRPRPP